VKFSFNWLSELVEGIEMPPQELGRLITMKTAECEGIETVGDFLPEVCAARVLSVEPLSGNTRLTALPFVVEQGLSAEGAQPPCQGRRNVKAIVDTGRHGIRTVVCGAPNCRPGIVSAYVPPGVRLGEREIATVVIGGVTSEGMLASGAELGINRDADGILDLEVDPGAAIAGCFPDSIIEIDNKSLTHRPDLWGHHGLAREVAAIVDGILRQPVRLDLLPHGPAPIQIEIHDFDLCPRYSALAFENVTVKPSPLWLQHRLMAIGLNPISNIVDVTNYVMAELAQPMHAFDWDLLRGPAILVRTAREGEHIVALNEEEYRLDPRDLVIADERGPIAIAGVIGGRATGIHAGTRRLILESANFQASSVRKTSARQKLRTDASMRFEKAQDPHNTVRGLARAVELLEEVSPGIRLVGGIADASRELAAPPLIELRMDWLARKLGRKVSMKEVVGIFERLEFGVLKTAPRVLSITVPSWRATRDISIKDDLVEEVGRMIGYGSIPIQPPALPAIPPARNAERLFHREVRAALVELGFTEVYNYSFVNQDEVRALGMDPEDHIKVANPISSDQGLMRRSLIPGIRRNIEQNSKHFEHFRLFEIGREIHPRAEGLPEEIPHLAAAVCARDDGAAGILELKRVAEHLMPGCDLLPAAARSFEHPVRAAEVHWRGNLMGRLFEMHPSLVETGRAAILDLDLGVLQRLSEAEEKRYTPIRRYPSSAFDLSVLTDLRDLVGDLRKKLEGFAGQDLVSIEFLRIYTGPPLPEGKKSVSFRLTVAAPGRTLSSDEAGATRSRIIEAMQNLGYELRL
jgi:phenylalanyl-tRNA synthetase beta chain